MNVFKIDSFKQIWRKANMCADFSFLSKGPVTCCFLLRHKIPHEQVLWKSFANAVRPNQRGYELSHRYNFWEGRKTPPVVPLAQKWTSGAKVILPRSNAKNSPSIGVKLCWEKVHRDSPSTGSQTYFLGTVFWAAISSRRRSIVTIYNEIHGGFCVGLSPQTSELYNLPFTFILTSDITTVSTFLLCLWHGETDKSWLKVTIHKTANLNNFSPSFPAFIAAQLK